MRDTTTEDLGRAVRRRAYPNRYWRAAAIFAAGALSALVVIGATGTRKRALAATEADRLLAADASGQNARQRETTREGTRSYVADVASAFHDAWRAGRRRPDGTYEPRLKKTKDATWIKTHGTSQVDIANTSYADLPADWQAENKASAEVAVRLILGRQGQPLTPEFIEKSSQTIHDRWLERNPWAKGGELDRPYGSLAEPEKQKDREVLYQAIQTGLERKMIAPEQVTPPVSQAIQQMLAKIKR
jgi:hypothetical protein